MAVPISGHDDTNFWTASPLHHGQDAERQQARLIVQVVANAVPLDRDRPLFDQGNVPQALAMLLFPRPAEPANSTNMPQDDLRTYAVIDGERLANTPELLEASGLDHRSLFGEDADERMIRSGPWLVEIDLDSRFTRNFFLSDEDQESATALWMKNWGIFIRSPSDIAALARHLRKFTKVQDEHGQWFYFRFWDADFMGLYLRQPAAPGFPLVQRLLDPGEIRMVVAVSPFDGVNAVQLEMPCGGAQTSRPQIGFRRNDFDAVGVDLADRRAARAYDESYHQILRGEELDSLRRRISTARVVCRQLGITEEGLPGTFILLGTVFARDFWRDQAFAHYWATASTPPDKRFRTYLSGLKSEMIRAKLPLRPWW